MPGDIWVWLGPEADGSSAASREALAVGAAMAAVTGGRLDVLTVDAPPGLGLWGPRAAEAVRARPELSGEGQRVEAILFPDRPESADLAATLAATLGCGLVSHCARVERPGQEWLFCVPAFGGLAAIVCQGRPPALVGLSTGARYHGPGGDAADAQSRIDGAFGRPIRLELPAAGPDDPVVLDEPAGDRAATAKDGGAAAELSSARLVVAGGAGAGDPEGWRLVSDLAESLGAGLGATRPAVDEGWAPAEVMIGQSGRRVKPAAYVTLGISGDLQHLVGVGEETTVVAVNSDPAAPILGRADYAVVADLKEFLPVLIDRARRRRETKGPSA
ncbi:MAG TPA: electron transfer flavoprotein subunit alpha/FixB family protein [Bacillota bacterium]